MTLRHGQAVWLMVLVTLLWSTAGVVTRQLESAVAFEVTFWRSLFTLLSLLVILPLWQGLALWQTLRQGGGTLWASGLCWCVMFTAFMVALTLTSVANVLITLAVGPLLTALFARVAIGHRIAPRTAVAILVAGVGIAWMFGRQLGDGHWVGSLVAFCVPLAGATHWTLVQRARVRGQRQDLVPAVLLGALMSTVLALPLAWPLQASLHDIAWLAGLGLGQLAIPCVLAVICARVLSAPEVSLLALLEVVFGIALAWFGASEAPQASVLQGGALVLGALLFNEWLGWRERQRLHSQVTS